MLYKDLAADPHRRGVMTKSLDFKLSVLLLREGEAWVAQCLDYDIAAQGKTIAEAKDAFARTFAGQVFVDLNHNVEPLHGFSPAPQEYWEQFEKGERLKDRQPIYIPKYDATTPAVNVHAAAEDLRIAA